MNVFGVSHRLKVCIVLLSIIVILTCISLLLIPFISLPEHSQASQLYNLCCSVNILFYSFPICIFAVIAAGVLLIMNVFRKKIIFTDDAIISKDVFTTRKLSFTEIKGYGVNRFSLYIETNPSSRKRRMTINLASLKRADNLIHNLESRFANLDFLKTE